jgi:hypothetical protein
LHQNWQEATRLKAFALPLMMGKYNESNYARQVAESFSKPTIMNLRLKEKK